MTKSEKDIQIEFLQESVNALATRLEHVEFHRDKLLETLDVVKKITDEFVDNFMDGDDRFASAIIASIRKELS